MKLYSVFDDFDEESVDMLAQKGYEVVLHPKGEIRPDKKNLVELLGMYDGIIIGTSQTMSEDMFESINSSKIIATASVGVDHIRVPDKKRDLIKIYNAPTANVQSVAEFTMGCALACFKRLREGNGLYMQGKDNKCLARKPEDMMGKVLGVVGAGNISVRIMQWAELFGMKILCWTAHPEKHTELLERGIQFVDILYLVQNADLISVNLPNQPETRKLISRELIFQMKETAIFISISRLDVLEVDALIERAQTNPNFYVCLDIDVNGNLVEALPDISNLMVTPHIAGGTIEARKRMFKEVTMQIIDNE